MTSSVDPKMRGLVSKVMETARCNINDAEISLRENNNDPDLAVLALVERPEREVWKESKSRKTKKQEPLNGKEEANTQHRRQDRAAPRNRDNQQPQRGGGDEGFRGRQTRNNFSGRFNRDGGSRDNKQPFSNAGGGRGRFAEKNAKDSRGPHEGGSQRNFQPQQQPQPKKEEKTPESAWEDVEQQREGEEDAWKNGPLVFEATSTTSSAPAPATTNGRLSFAEVAKAKPKVAPPPAPSQRPPATQPAAVAQQQQEQPQQDYGMAGQRSGEGSGEVPPQQAVAEHIVESSEAYASAKGNFPSTETAPAAFGTSGPLNVNKEYTDNLKSVIGLKPTTASRQTSSQSIASQEQNIAPVNEAAPLMQSVEFVGGDVPSSGMGFQFEFGHFSAESNTGANQELGKVTYIQDRSQAPLPSTAEFDRNAQKTIRPSVPVSSAATGLQTFTGPQQSAAMYAAPFPNYSYQPYMNLYSPLSAEMRHSDQYSAATAAALAMPHFPTNNSFGMGQLGDSLGLVMPPAGPLQQQQQQPTQQPTGGATGTPPSQHRQQTMRQQTSAEHVGYIDSMNKQAQAYSTQTNGASSNQNQNFPLMVTSSYQQPRANMVGSTAEAANALNTTVTSGPPPGFGNLPANMNLPFMQPSMQNFQNLFQMGPPSNSYPQQMAALPLLFGATHGGQQNASQSKYGGGNLGGGGGGMNGGKGGAAQQYQQGVYGGGQKKNPGYNNGWN